MATLNIFLKESKYIYLIFLLSLLACQAQDQQHPKKNQKAYPAEYAFTNELIHESSPYLLQHAHNPVNWFPWSTRALELAKKEDKLLIISIGYAACHWCHVMEHESFEDTAVATLMNDRFVAVKIDREERPDIDDIYMTACQLTNPRSCGWPLNAIALPDGRPIFVGTYYPKDQWITILEKLSATYEEDPEKANEYAGQLTKGIQALSFTPPQKQQVEFKEKDLHSITSSILTNIDFKKGGQLQAPKFPMPSLYHFLLQYAHTTENEKAWEAVKTTLDEMAKGGIYDHLGGGFARYSTDDEWIVPHFEKMLYDNAQLVSLYAKAYQKTSHEKYRQIVSETLSFIQRELTNPEGGFYSSLDADSEGEEGKFYVWKKDEWDQVLEEDAELLATYFEVAAEGNWEEEKNILYRRAKEEEIIGQYNISLATLREKVNRGKERLFNERTKRIRPGLDDKIITAWNALMISGYVDAYHAFNDSLYLKEAIQQARFLQTFQIQKDYRIYRIHKEGKSSINGFLDDYALTALAFIDLYQATFDESWLNEARSITEYALDHFFDTSTQTFFYTSDEDPPLISRQKELGDNVIPGSNSSMSQVLFLLGTYFYHPEWIDISHSMLNTINENLQEQPSYHSNWASTLYNFIYPPYEVAIVGTEVFQLKEEFDQMYYPDAIFLGSLEAGNLPLLENKWVQGKTIIYVCQDKICKLPVDNVKAAVELMNRTSESK